MYPQKTTRQRYRLNLTAEAETLEDLQRYLQDFADGMRKFDEDLEQHSSINLMKGKEVMLKADIFREDIVRGFSSQEEHDEMLSSLR